jgi:hypothetical protein
MGLNAKRWLGCKDSNLDRQSQNLGSCHWTTSHRVAGKYTNRFNASQDTLPGTFATPNLMGKDSRP